MQGDPPSHPELLDWLASEYVRCGWSRKAMIRKIVCSATYRQSSRARPELAERDPKNQLLARQNRFRLEAEPVRDTILATSGLLNQRIGGPGFCVNLSPDDVPDDWEPQLPPQDPWDIYRRGLYVIAKRTDPDPLLDGTRCSRRHGKLPDSPPDRYADSIADAAERSDLCRRRASVGEGGRSRCAVRRVEADFVDVRPLPVARTDRQRTTNAERSVSRRDGRISRPSATSGSAGRRSIPNRPIWPKRRRGLSSRGRF